MNEDLKELLTYLTLKAKSSKTDRENCIRHFHLNDNKYIHVYSWRNGSFSVEYAYDKKRDWVYTTFDHPAHTTNISDCIEWINNL